MRKIIGLFVMLAPLIAGANIVDNSANQPGFPPPGLTLLSTVVAQSGSRAAITVQNQDTDNLELWRDTACTGVQLSLIVLAPATSTNDQGGAWSSNTFKGCMRIYGTAGQQISVWQD